ncbi:MAG: hypothetical protein COC19_08040 [SAR86 cluster bacterium]|uniref:GNAT family N-acetyltransferase n=1 Tax=SAR86 cluster bacterium TaxID=2030880 RepID=A0A2A4MH64_9GAMM|nr:MAG: hypothetical protein COC19_08040 [SAR86 cluster bacterium]
MDKITSKLSFKTITSEEETSQFLDKIEDQTDVKLPTEYANNSKIVGVFLQNELVGGYMLVTKPYFRSLLFVPDKIKIQHPFFKNDEYEMMEVNGLWLGAAIKTPKLQYRFWMHLVKDIFLAKKKYLLLMSDSKNKNIEYIHNLTKPEIFYQGAPDLMAGDKSHSSIRVGFTTRWSLVLNAPKYFLELKSRQSRVKKGAKQRAFNRAIKQD